MNGDTRPGTQAVILMAMLSLADVHVSGGVTLFGGSYGSSTAVGGGAMDFKGKATSSGIPRVSSRDLEESNAERYQFTATFGRRAKPDGRS
jgi:hypothetical protein